MTDNTFIFRRSYDFDEKKDRIHSEKFTTEKDEVVEIIDEMGGNIPDKTTSFSKGAFLDRVRDNVSEDRYREFVNDMFSKYGVKGDILNFRLYEIDEHVSLDDFKGLSDKVGDQIDEKDDDQEVEGGDLRRSVELLEVSINESVVDIKLGVEDNEYIQPDEDTTVERVKDQGEYEVLDDLIKLTHKYSIELRYYFDKNLVAITNRDTDPNEQKSYIDLCNEVVNND